MRRFAPTWKSKLPKPIILRRVVGQSMQPNLVPGQIILASGLYRSLKPKTMVVLSHDGQEKVKRVSQVKTGKVYVLGDNPASSLDSRSFGWLPTEHITGKVIWPRT